MSDQDLPPYCCPEHHIKLAHDGTGWRCPEGHAFPVVRGIPRFVERELYASSFGYQWNRFSTTQLDRDVGESHATLTEKTGFRRGDLAGRTVLEAGCGMGRFLSVVAGWGAIPAGVDLSTAVEAAQENLGAKARIAQADVFALPFADHSFDVVYSLGVLHHTPDTHAAFRALARVVKPEGHLAVWVYSRERRDRLADGLKYLYRRTTRRMEPARLARLARLAVPMYTVHSLPVVGRVSRRLLPTSMHPDPEWRVLDTLDDYSPFYRWRHTYEEVERWFRDEGFVDVRSLAFPVSVRGRRPG